MMLKYDQRIPRHFMHILVLRILFIKGNTGNGIKMRVFRGAFGGRGPRRSPWGVRTPEYPMVQ